MRGFTFLLVFVIGKFVDLQGLPGSAMAGDGTAWSFALSGGFALSPAGPLGNATSKGKGDGKGMGGINDNLAGYQLMDPHGNLVSLTHKHAKRMAKNR